jgi:hypothetical protein
MIEDGLLDADPKPDAAFVLHIFRNFRAGAIAGRPGPLFAAVDTRTIRGRGRGGHASMPHLAVDPVPVAREIGVALHAMVTRRSNVFDPIVLTCGKISGGTASNIIPETVEMRGLGDPIMGRGVKARGVDRDPIRGSPQGQRPCAPRRTGRTHVCTRPSGINTRIPLRGGGRPHTLLDDSSQGAREGGRSSFPTSRGLGLSAKSGSSALHRTRRHRLEQPRRSPISPAENP